MCYLINLPDTFETLEKTLGMSTSELEKKEERFEAQFINFYFYYSQLQSMKYFYSSIRSNHWILAHISNLTSLIVGVSICH